MTKVYDVKQRPDKSSTAFLEQLMEAFHQHTPYDSSSKECKATVTMAFTDQASRDIRQSIQRLKRQDKPLRDLVQVAKKVYHYRKTEKEKEQRRRRKEK